MKHLLLSQAEVDELAGPYFPRIYSVIHASFSDYLATLRGIAREGRKANLKARTSASLIHDFIRGRAREEFSQDTNLRIDEFNGMFGILLPNKLFIRFKKLNPDLQTSNVRTGQVKEFDSQQLTFSEMESLTFLTAGYVPDATWTSILNVFLTCKRNKEVIWHKDIYAVAAPAVLFPSTEVMTDIELPVVRLKEGNSLGEASSSGVK